MKIVMKIKKCNKKEWTPWFAWRPVVALDDYGNEYWVWGETVERKWNVHLIRPVKPVLYRILTARNTNE